MPLVPPPPALPEELEAAAFARLPRAVYDYYAGGAGDDVGPCAGCRVA